MAVEIKELIIRATVQTDKSDKKEEENSHCRSEEKTIGLKQQRLTNSLLQLIKNKNER